MEEYVVEVNAHPTGDLRPYAEALATAFDISPQKAELMLKRLPGVVTKPVPERIAEVVAMHFSRAGLAAVVRPEGFEQSSLRMTMSDSFTDSSTSENPFATGGNFTFDAKAKAAQAYAAKPPKGEDAEIDPMSTLVTEGQRRGSIRRKLLFIALIPTILTIVGALAVTWFTVRPALYQQLLDSARNPAIATAASLSSAISNTAGPEAAVSLQLLDTIQVARQTFPRESIGFIVATNSEGEPLSAWFEEERGFASSSRDLENAIREQALKAMEDISTDDQSAATSQLDLPGGERLEIVAQPLLRGNTAFGTVVVGVTDEAVTAQVNRILLSIAFFSLIPLSLAILFAIARARAFTQTVLYLTGRADEISRGKLEGRVDKTKSHDELDDLSQALERMRVSMQEALERLRRRRN